MNHNNNNFIKENVRHNCDNLKKFKLSLFLLIISNKIIKNKETIYCVRIN